MRVVGWVEAQWLFHMETSEIVGSTGMYKRLGESG